MELRNALDCGGDRTCTTASHWAPFGRVNHGSTPTTCVHGQDHSDAVECVYRCAATMPGHQCTRSEHADDRHVWAMSDEEAQRILRAGQDMGFVAEADPLDESDHRPRHLADGMHLAYGEGCGRWHTTMVDLPCDCRDHGPRWRTLAWWEAAPVPEGAADGEPLTFCDCEPEPEADPLDESDHRPRHFPDGAHLRRYACGHWHLATRDRCNDPDHGDSHTLAWWADSESLTFCDCDDATIEAENGATD